MGAQLVFALCRKYGISVAVLWYILVKLLVKLIDQNVWSKQKPQSVENHQLGANATKMATK